MFYIWLFFFSKPILILIVMFQNFLKKTSVNELKKWDYLCDTDIGKFIYTSHTYFKKSLVNPDE
jgi:hypothetical protein